MYPQPINAYTYFALFCQNHPSFFVVALVTLTYLASTLELVNCNLYWKLGLQNHDRMLLDGNISACIHILFMLHFYWHLNLRPYFITKSIHYSFFFYATIKPFTIQPFFSITDLFLSFLVNELSRVHITFPQLCHQNHQVT